MGRKPSENKKTRRIGFKLTEEDYQIMKKFSEDNKVRMTDYMYSRVIEKIKTGKSRY